jgi:hypothetical protein
LDSSVSREQSLKEAPNHCLTTLPNHRWDCVFLCWVKAQLNQFLKQATAPDLHPFLTRNGYDGMCWITLTCGDNRGYALGESGSEFSVLSVEVQNSPIVMVVDMTVRDQPTQDAPKVFVAIAPKSAFSVLNEQQITGLQVFDLNPTSVCREDFVVSSCPHFIARPRDNTVNGFSPAPPSLDDSARVKMW